jgi:hypothetical protein
MKFKKTLQKQYQRHLQLPIISENLDKEQMNRLVGVANEIKQIIGNTQNKTEVLKFLFDTVMTETTNCMKCAKMSEDEETQYEEDEFTLTPAQRDAINVAYTLGQGKAKGGLASTLTGGLVGDPVKKIQKAYGTLLSKVATELDKAAQGIGQSTM